VIADWLLQHPDYREVPEMVQAEDEEASAQERSIREYVAREKTKVKPDKPMRWYWFLVHIALVFSSFMNIWSGYQLFMGSSYGGREAAEKIYELYDGMKVIDMVYAALLILMGFLALYVRSQLYHYKRSAPRKLLLLYALNGLVALYYSVGVSQVTGISLLDTDILYVIPGTIIMIIINKIYFSHRKHLFIR
jgi:hypothetical protein